MKQLKQVFYVNMVLLMILFVGCGFFGDQQYVCEIEDVVLVQIVRLNDIGEGGYNFNYTVLKEISKREEFVNCLTKMKQRVNWGEPSVLEEGNIVVRVEFSNGDYDLIYHNIQLKHRSGTNHTGYIFFDEKQFKELISQSEDEPLIAH